VLLAASAALVPMSLRRHRGRRSVAEQRRDDRLAWVSLGLMGLFSSLFVLTLLRDAALFLAGSSTSSAAPRSPRLGERAARPRCRWSPSPSRCSACGTRAGRPA
jgi:hypothetical protein